MEGVRLIPSSTLPSVLSLQPHSHLEGSSGGKAAVGLQLSLAPYTGLMGPELEGGGPNAERTVQATDGK